MELYKYEIHVGSTRWRLILQIKQFCYCKQILFQETIMLIGHEYNVI